MGGTPTRMLEFAQMLKNDLEPVLGHLGDGIEDLSIKGGRYSMFKVGPVLTVNVSNSQTLIVE